MLKWAIILSTAVLTAISRAAGQQKGRCQRGARPHHHCSTCLSPAAARGWLGLTSITLATAAARSSSGHQGLEEPGRSGQEGNGASQVVAMGTCSSRVQG